jgi:hypothetical protein
MRETAVGAVSEHPSVRCKEKGHPRPKGLNQKPLWIFAVPTQIET